MSSLSFTYTWNAFDNIFNAISDERLMKIMSDESADTLLEEIRKFSGESKEEIAEAIDGFEKIARMVIQQIDDDLLGIAATVRESPLWIRYVFNKKEAITLITAFENDSALELNPLDRILGVYLVLKTLEMRQPGIDMLMLFLEWEF